MFNISSVKHHVYKVADFLEYKAVVDERGHCSINSLRALLSAPDDEMDINGTEEGDDKVVNKLQESLTTCAVRNHSYKVYPFTVNLGSIDFSLSNPLDIIYIFLLLANRLDMQTEKIQGGMNATELFERLCRVVATSYLGVHSKCEIFGTSVPGSFQDKVNDILKKLRIPGEFNPPTGWTGHQQDGGIDLVAWIPFDDSLDSQLIALGQCKTGTNWEIHLKRKQFFQEYSTKQPLMEPVYMFFVCEDFETNKWEDHSRGGGILFNRKRIMSLIPDKFHEVEQSLYEDIKVWVEHAIAYIKGQ